MVENPNNEKLEKEIQLYHEGKSTRAYDLFGSFCETRDDQEGAVFRVWAPNAVSVSVTGDFNQWDSGANPMKRINEGGIWECFVPGIKRFDMYK